MAGLTKSEIESALLSGGTVEWTDANGKRAAFHLADAKQRRLFAFLLSSKVRQPTNLTETFVGGLQTSYDASDDPAAKSGETSAPGTGSGPWRLYSIETWGFGGLNTWKGAPFEFEFDGESCLLEGPNGSGKSSLIGAVIWALVGERPRDQSDANAHEPKPVFVTSDKPAGEWPPIACYPPTAAELRAAPEVRVKLTFADPSGSQATVERKLSLGAVTHTVSPNFVVPSVLIETGLLMPARLAQLRFDEGGGRLTDAVQALTGLDDLVAIGTLADGLCHKTREYRAYRAKELAALIEAFNQALETARSRLRGVNIDVPEFKPNDTDDVNGNMAALGDRLRDLAAEHASVVANDIKAGLDLGQTKVQNEVIANISMARGAIEAGLNELTAWKTLSGIAANSNDEQAKNIQAAVSTARSQITEACELLRKSNEDTRFQLKALGARWHELHASGPIEKCPLCQLDLKDRKELAEELESLRSIGDAATKAFDDNINAIVSKLEEAIPGALRKLGPELLTMEPRGRLLDEIRTTFVERSRYADCLTKVAALVGEALNSAPPATLAATKAPEAPADAPAASRALGRIATADRLVELGRWFGQNAEGWTAWWNALAQRDEANAEEAETGSEAKEEHERLITYLDRLSDALEKAGPYRDASEAMLNARKAGKAASEILNEVHRRNAIAESLQPLKTLGALCESVTREAINGLSGRIAGLLGEILIAEQLQYKRTTLDRKEGLVVQAGFSPDFRIDATLVANSSWLRAVLWSFVFALREEAVEHFCADSLPLLTFDDPQATFDTFHRARWAHYLSGLQNGASKLQVVIATYDESFVDLVRADGITGREALLVAPGLLISTEN